MNLLEGAQLMVSALVVPVLSKLADRVGHRRVLLWSTAVSFAASASLAVAPGFWLFLIAWAWQGFYVVWLPLEIALLYIRYRVTAEDGQPAVLTRRAAGVLVGALEAGAIASQASVLIGVHLISMVVGALGVPVPARLPTPRWALIVACALNATGCLLFLPLHHSMAQVTANVVVIGRRRGHGRVAHRLPVRLGLLRRHRLRRRGPAAARAEGRVRGRLRAEGRGGRRLKRVDQTTTPTAAVPHPFRGRSDHTDRRGLMVATIGRSPLTGPSVRPPAPIRLSPSLS